MRKIQTKEVLNYVIMPGVMPRLQELFGSGTGMLAFLIANIFQATRLLPAAHPYVNPANMRRFGVRDVFAAGASHLVFDRKHLDQIAIFGILLLGFVLFILQFVMLLGSVLVHPAHAAFGGMFTTTYNNTDIAFELMDRVFGVPGLFDSCVSTGTPCTVPAPATFPTPFQDGLHLLFKYYSVGLLIVAVIIFLYYCLVVIAETAQTGTPFGRRFSHIWAPIRLVVALGLLVPMSYGLNAGQYIVLYAAKLGSGFATNGWVAFNQTLTNGLGVSDQSLFVRPKTPDSWPLLKFMYLASTCHEAYDLLGVKDIKPYLVKVGPVNTSYQEVTTSSTYDQAIAFYDKGDVVVRFGKRDPKLYANELGGVKALCGEIAFPTTATSYTGALKGPYGVQSAYYEITVRSLWNYPSTTKSPYDFALYYAAHLPGDTAKCNTGALRSTHKSAITSSGTGCTEMGADFITLNRADVQTNFDNGVTGARTNMISGASLTVDPALLQKGWAGAGIWYNKIAEINGAFIGAINMMPIVTKLPMPMATVYNAKKGKDQNPANTKGMFDPNRSDGAKINFHDSNEKNVAQVLYDAYSTLSNDDTYSTTSDTMKKNNVFIDAINLLFGTTGLFNMRQNSDIHPLAQLVGLGKGILDAAVRNLLTASVFSVGGGLLSAFPNTAGIGGFFNMAGNILVTITTISLTVGFVLYYVLPFLPFMYFFFAVGAWLKTIFEAMVGVPLWALGHLRIDGHGLPGESAVGGYYMIFEIFVRPILTVFGLIGGLIIFSAMAKVLNETFQLVTDNLSGYDMTPCIPTGAGSCSAASGATLTAIQGNRRGVVDEFFFTIIYTVIIYLMATSSFKMIDQIPSQILRWMGAGVHVFADNIGDAHQHMTAYLAGGAANMTSQLTMGVTGGMQRLGMAGGSLTQSLATKGATATKGVTKT